MARIFIAIRFDNEVKKTLVGLQDTLGATIVLTETFT